jgi:hypothetical protein
LHTLGLLFRCQFIIDGCLHHLGQLDAPQQNLLQDQSPVCHGFFQIFGDLIGNQLPARSIEIFGLVLDGDTPEASITSLPVKHQLAVDRLLSAGIVKWLYIAILFGHYHFFIQPARSFGGDREKFLHPNLPFLEKTWLRTCLASLKAAIYQNDDKVAES